MRGFSPKPELEIGGTYRDVDGSLVTLVTAHRNVCCWIPIGCASDASQMTHRDNFLRRFVAVRPVPAPARTARTKQTRRVSQAVLLAKAA